MTAMADPLPVPPRRARAPSLRPAASAGLLAALLAAACGPTEREARFAEVSVPPPPEARTVPVVDTLHGTPVADPYRWLEERETEETRVWVEDQNGRTDSVFAQLPGRERLRELARRLLEIEEVSTPNLEGGRYFFSRRAPDQELAVLYYREGPEGEDRVLLDPHPMSEDHTTSVHYRAISEDGELVVYAVRRGGVDEVELRALRVEGREALPDVLPEARYGSVQLSPDKRDLYYVKYGAEEPRIYMHRMGTDPARDRPIFGEGYTRRHIPVASLSDDGRWLLVHVIDGSSGPTEIFLKDLAADGPFRTVISDGESRSFASFAGDRLAIVTDLEAPNKRVMVAGLTEPAVGNWRELVPESEERVITGVSPVGGRLFVSYMRDVQPRIAQHEVDGTLVREIGFDEIGSAYGVSGDWDEREGFFTYTSFHRPATIFRMDVATGEREVWHRTEVPIDAESIEVRQVWYESKDGTRVPMFLVHREGIERSGDHATYLTGYGGFNVSRTPGFSPTAAAWVELGGLYALPNLRGGGEFGEEWHRAGMLGAKQNVFDDFLAAAEWLVENGYTRPERLAIAGGSNGGLLVGAAITQRPELFGAAVINYPLLDMVRYHRFLVARFWVPEYGSAEDPEQFEALYAYSPYHRVESGAAYPATLLVSGDGDTRVDPLHARKMAARLQAAQGGEAPILLRYHTKAGHSGGQPVSERVDDLVDVLSFLMWRVGDPSWIAARRTFIARTD